MISSLLFIALSVAFVWIAPVDSFASFSSQYFQLVPSRVHGLRFPRETIDSQLFGWGNGVSGEELDLREDNLESKEIKRLKKRNAELMEQIEATKAETEMVQKELDKMESEYGSEIVRVKKEFARMKERSYEESLAAASKAKVDALKEVLPVMDNFVRAKQLFEPNLKTEEDNEVFERYAAIFETFSKVIEDFGCTLIESVGQPFDFNMMEAVMTAPSAEYAENVVCTEYQVGYKMGDKCIRPSMVVVSTGPGPS